MGRDDGAAAGPTRRGRWPRGWVLGVVATLALAGAPPVWAIDAGRAGANMARRAAVAYESGEYKRAAQLYLDAYRTDPSQPAYLFGCARAEMVAGDTWAAEGHFEEFLAQPSGDRGRSQKAEAYLAELRVHNAPSRARRVTGWVLVGSGAALAIGGTALWLSATSDAAKLHSELAIDGDGYATGPVTWREARSRADSIGNHKVIAASLIGIGMAAAGVGAALVLGSTPAAGRGKAAASEWPTLRVVPSWDGIAVAGVF